MKQKIFSLYNYDDYRAFLKAFVRDRKINERGVVGKLAMGLGVNSAMVSQILHEKSHLSTEQAYKLTKHFGFSKLETEFFMALVSMNRAGDRDTRKYFLEKVTALAKAGQALKEQLDYQDAAAPFNEGVYYSQWYFSAVWLLAAIAPQTKQSYLAILKISEEALDAVLNFLVESSMLNFEMGQYTFKGRHIHAGKESTHLRQHHVNYRLKAIQLLQTEDLKANFNFTGPIVVSKADAAKINMKILDFLKEFREISGPSACEELHCLNIDWFKIQ